MAYLNPTFVSKSEQKSMEIKIKLIYQLLKKNIMIKRGHCWIIANLGWLTITGIIAVVILVCFIFIPTHSDKVRHATMIANHGYQIKQFILKFLLTFLSLSISFKTAMFAYKNYDEVLEQRLFKSSLKVFTSSPVGYSINRFLMTSVFYIFISSTILVFT